MERTGQKMQSIGRTMSTWVTLPIVGAGTAAVMAATKMDSLTRGLTAVAGGSDEAERQLVRLREVAKLPGLGMEEAIQGSINLQAAGFSATQAEAALMNFGNALATVGRGKAELDGVLRALTQIASKGVISAEEINQLAERLPQIRQAMKDAFGTSNTEELQKMGIEATVFVDKITAEFGKLERVTTGPQIEFENMSDSVKLMAASFGDVMMPVVMRVTKAIGSFAEIMIGVPAPVKGVILVVAALAATIGPLVFTLGTIQRMLPMLKVGWVALTGPIGLSITAIAALVAAYLMFRDEVNAVVTNVYNTIKTYLVDKFMAVVGFVGEKIGAITGFFGSLYDKLLGGTGIDRAIQAVGSSIRDMATSGLDALGDGIQWVAGHASTAVDKLGDMASSVLGLGDSAADAAVDLTSLGTAAGGVGQAVADMNDVLPPMVTNLATAETIFERMGRIGRQNAERLREVQQAFIDAGGDLEKWEMPEHLKKSEKAVDELGDAFKNMGDTMADGLAAAMVGAKFSIKDFVQSALRDLARLAIKMAAMRLIGNIAGGAAGGAGGAILGGILAGFAGGAAVGANVHPGQSWLVGERGPEIFEPGQVGQVRPVAAPMADDSAIASLMAKLDQRPRPMTPVEASNDEWWSTMVSLALKVGMSRGMRLEGL